MYKVAEMDGVFMMVDNVDDLYWYYQDQRDSRDTHPYNFSPYFIFGSHKTIKGASAEYSDRYALWDQEKLKAALEASGAKHPHSIDNPTTGQKFVTAYYGENYELVGIVQWCNASTGYPLKSFHIKKLNG